MNTNTNTLYNYISNLKKNIKNKCECNSKENKSPSSKAQNVKICKNTVIKGPKNKTEIRVEKAKNGSIKLDNITMNLLIQTIINKYISKNLLGPYNVEHYTKLCKNNNNITKLVSSKSDFSFNGTSYNTLEDYIKNNNSNDITKIDFIEKCLIQSFEQLDILYRDLQFHHCDCKAAQLFLFLNKNNSNIKCMLADLDKVTFTLFINGTPYRIRLTKDNKKNTFKGTILSLFTLNKMTEMRFSNFPKKSNLFEKIAFVSSACILLKNIDSSKKLRDNMLANIFNKYQIKRALDYDKIINLNEYFSFFRLRKFTNKDTSLSTPIKYIGYDYLLSIDEIKHLLQNEEELKSKIHLSKKNNNLHNIEIKLNKNNRTLLKN